MSPVHETAQESDVSEEDSSVTASKSNGIGSNGNGSNGMFFTGGAGAAVAGSNGAEVLRTI
jgi:hypothetical protein